MFTRQPSSFIKYKEYLIPSFLTGNESNIDIETVTSFGEEWEAFHDFNNDEIEQIGNDYFDIVPPELFNQFHLVLDVGCGSGRWSKYLSNKVGKVIAIDPSKAVCTASELLRDHTNVEVIQTSVDNMPFENDSFDFVFSLGVLHHIPDTQAAIKKCIEKLKPKGFFLIYLYYNLDNRGVIFKLLFKLSNLIRRVVSQLPKKVKKLTCTVLAVILYLPFIFLGRIISRIGFRNIAKKLPLAYYQKTSFYIVKNDALDRFGTPLEQRFSKVQITNMLEEVGLFNVQFSSQPPYWHALAQKK